MRLIIIGAALTGAALLAWALARAGDSDQDCYALTPLAEEAVRDPLGLWYQLGSPGPLEQLGEQDELLVAEDLDPEPFAGGGIW